MIRSMTGFGRSEGVYDGMTISVEVKTVNHRYFEYNCRVPRAYLFLEDRLKQVFSKKIIRGKTDVFLTVKAGENANTKITLDNTYVTQYLSAINELCEKYGIKNDITASSLAANSDIFLVDNNEVDEDEFFNAVSNIADRAIDVLVEMRQTEGQKLAEDIRHKAAEILKLVEFVEARQPETIETYSKKLYEKIAETLGDRTVDEQRLLTEVAIFADRVAVDEETVRLKSHIEQLSAMLDSDDAVGRRLDFLVQEMNRETNTIGSKAQNVDVARAVVDIKALIEKIREQIQNIE